MRSPFQETLGVLLLSVAVVVVCTATGCTETPKLTPAQAYLTRLYNKLPVQSRAESVCTQDQKSPFATSKPIVDPIVAVNSTIAFVRTLEAPGYAKRTGDEVLSGTTQGYAAICLFKTAQNGAPVNVWSYALPSGDSGGIDAE